MPWEIDYALLTFTQLKKSSYYISKKHKITIDSVLNLSSKIIKKVISFSIFFNSLFFKI